MRAPTLPPGAAAARGRAPPGTKAEQPRHDRASAVTKRLSKPIECRRSQSSIRRWGMVLDTESATRPGPQGQRSGPGGPTTSMGGSRPAHPDGNVRSPFDVRRAAPAGTLGGGPAGADSRVGPRTRPRGAGPGVQPGPSRRSGAPRRAATPAPGAYARTSGSERSKANLSLRLIGRRRAGTRPRSRRRSGASRSPRDRLVDAREREVGQRVGAELGGDLLDRAAVGDHLLARGHVDAVVARVLDRRRRDPHVDLARARVAQHLHDLARRVAAHDRVVDDDQALAADDLGQRVELHPQAVLAQLLAGLDERPRRRSGS